MSEPAAPVSALPRVLLVDDEAMLSAALARQLSSLFETEAVNSGEAALDALARRPFRLVLLDVSMPGMNGLDALVRIREEHPEVEVVMMTGNGTIDTAVEAMKRGAFEFLQKPFESTDHLTLVMRRAIERGELRAQNRELRAQMPPRGLIGEAPAMRAIAALVGDLAHSDVPVLIEGESGTGKEVLARAIHSASGRANRPFVAVNCGAIPETVLESELFGHEKGSFTGAVSSTRGLFRAAHEGTILLDEIGEISPAIQVKLLRVLQEKEVRPLGATVSHKVDVRVIAATNRNLKDRIAKREFRDDLYYRLAVVPVRIPPLRDRREDIPLLVRHFLQKQNREGQKFEGISPEAMARLVAWNWPGNVRELENTIARAFALGRPGILSLEHLSPEIAGIEPAAGSAASAPRAELDALPLSLDAFEKFALERALREAQDDAGRAAELLGIPRSTFYRRLQKHGIRSAK